jgi:hypothetical protein
MGKSRIGSGNTSSSRVSRLGACSTRADGFLGPGKELLAKLQSDEKLMAVASASEGLKEMGILFDYLEIFGVLNYVSRFGTKKPWARGNTG